MSVILDKHTHMRSTHGQQLEAQGVECRGCGGNTLRTVVDLGLSPLCESLVQPSQLHLPEAFYPLCTFICESCWLMQLPEHVSGTEIFDESYAYQSSVSKTWLRHCEEYVERITKQISLDSQSQVIEIACNDGYLLKNFVSREIPCLGIEPATKVAAIAMDQGIPVRTEFFGQSLAAQLVEEGLTADLMIGNNVLAHVPDIHDFLAGFKRVLKSEGTITFEFPHLLNLLNQNQFDTIYQEHYCYLSLLALEGIFARHGLRLYDVEELATHGGSLRIFLCHQDAEISTEPAVAEVMQRERAARLDRLETYQGFALRVSETKWRLLEFLIAARREGKRVAAYGAPGKGNTLLNYCGIREDLIEFTVDRNTMKQGTLLVGSRIPVYEPSAIDHRKPDYVVILPWNLKDEIIAQLAHVGDWGGKFVVPIPELQIITPNPKEIGVSQ